MTMCLIFRWKSSQWLGSGLKKSSFGQFILLRLLLNCTNRNHWSESELHLDLALEKQERLSKEMSKKMENKKLFDESEFAILYLQEYIHTCQDSVKTIEDMVKEAGKGAV